MKLKKILFGLPSLGALALIAYLSYIYYIILMPMLVIIINSFDKLSSIAYLIKYIILLSNNYIIA